MPDRPTHRGSNMVVVWPFIGCFEGLLMGEGLYNRATLHHQCKLWKCARIVCICACQHARVHSCMYCVSTYTEFRNNNNSWTVSELLSALRSNRSNSRLEFSNLVLLALLYAIKMSTYVTLTFYLQLFLCLVLMSLWLFPVCSLRCF